MELFTTEKSIFHTKVIPKYLLPIAQPFFLVCTGREHEFHYNQLDFTEESAKSSNYFDMSPLHPFRAFFNFIVLFGGNIGIPLLYGLTYKFTKKQNNKSDSGLSDEAQQKRRQKNLVSIRFNLMNWMLESVMILMIFMTTDKMIQTTFILVTSIGTPLIYYLGIAENRKQIEEFYQHQIRKVKKPAAVNHGDIVNPSSMKEVPDLIDNLGVVKHALTELKLESYDSMT